MTCPNVVVGAFEGTDEGGFGLGCRGVVGVGMLVNGVENHGVARVKSVVLFMSFLLCEFFFGVFSS